MPLYNFRAITSDGRIRHGWRDARDEADLGAILAADGLELLSSKPRKAAHKIITSLHGGGGTIKSRLSDIPLPRLASICTQLATMCKAKIPLPTALQHLAENEPSRIAKERLNDMRKAIENGLTPSEAAAVSPQFLDPLSIAVLKTGEISGNITTALEHIAESILWKHKWKQTLTKSLRYPLFLVFLAICVTSFMMVAVVPQVTVFLETIGTPLPFISRALIKTSQLTAGWWFWVLGAIAIIALTARIAVGFSLRASNFFDRIILRLPVIGLIQYNLAEARFIRSLVLLLDSGLDPVNALQIASKTLGNSSLEKKGMKAAQAVRNGTSLAQSCVPPLVSPITHSLLSNGEITGDISGALRGAAESSLLTAQTYVNSLLGVLEPTLTLLVGAQLAWVAIAVIGPVYGNLGVLSNGF